MRKYLFTLVIVLLFHYIVTQFNQHSITKNNRKINDLVTELTAAKNCNSELLAQNNKLCLRERIYSFAQTKLDMVCVASDDTDYSDRVMYVREEQKRNSLMFSLIDYMTPDLQALNSYSE
ncbi:MAG TPA: hypothetical protein PL063_00875 [Candidatus Cloacimonadota bacterium]|jgi:cell division protein FtsL|nr:hypothetical protein [Candidatus Cloacimonadales bacterium]HPY95745.1 hypothetical protein [Candidatus Cloacimonadota bacterium]HQB40275.1 hypothetical protein [Candidatus Cloacimonadota bacterium]